MVILLSRGVAVAAPIPGPSVAPDAAGASPGAAAVSGLRAEARVGLRLMDIQLHDPWILADGGTKTYYLYSSAPTRSTVEQRTGTLYYKSTNLLDWSGPYLAFLCPTDSWADPTENAWAPEVHSYQGKYYLFTTLHNSKKSLPSLIPTRPNHWRSTIIARADTPTGPFALIDKTAPTIPAEFMALDGTLYVDRQNHPWLVYAHEWIQKTDGTIEALPLKPDLSGPADKPIWLLKGSDAPWLHAQAIPSAGENHYVTDGPEFYRTKTGRLLMLWASYERNQFNRDGYVETIARSQSGELAGPWEQLGPLVGNDSGHGMLFRTFEGTLMLVIHQPFKNARAKLYEVEDTGDTVRLGRYRSDLSGPALGPQQGQNPQ